MKFNKIFFKASTLLCSFALMIAATSIDNICMFSVYQPKVPKSLDKYRKNS